MIGGGETPAELAAGVRAGEVRAIARAISLLEDGADGAAELLAALRGAGGDAHAVGVTGPPGAGKSTLVSALVAEARAAGRRVGVLSVDPSSPFSSGALLGDRIRLGEHFLDPDVFIRSMGSRGAQGGLAGATLEALLVLGAAGKEVVFVETVGAGQGEVGVRGLADTVLLVLMPGAGDAVQALKAGILEIPDLIAVNKRDLPGAEATAGELRAAFALAPVEAPEVVLTEARRRGGTDELWERIERHRLTGLADGSLARRRGENLVAEAVAVAGARARRYLENALGADPALEALLDEVRLERLDPLSAADRILRHVFPDADHDRPDPR